MTKPLLQPHKSLGQHFLHDQSVLRKIAEAARPAAGSGVVEIGPGTGNLTEQLLALFGPPRPRPPLVLVELDRRTPAVLAERFAAWSDGGGPFCPLILADAAQADWPAILADPLLGPQPVVVGNLPYYAALPILFALADLPVPPAKIVVMVQREVAERIAAQPGTPDRGQVSVKLQLRAGVKVALRVGRGAFQPPPKVESAVVVLEPALRPALGELPPWQPFSRLITAGFAMRRKTLANALRLGGYRAAAVEAALAQAEIDGRARAEVLTLPQWVRLGWQLAADRPAA